MLHLIFLGLGTGLVADEFWLLATGNFTTNTIYWAGQNLIAIVILGIGSLFVMKVMERRDKMQNVSGHPYHKNPKHPVITVVVPALNEEKFLENNLTSIVNQTFKNFELIVVDNNSTDKTAEIAKRFGAKVIFNPTVGVGGARQAGFMEAKGEIIATTDADNILPDYWLERIVSEFKQDKELVAFGGLFQLYSGPLTARIAVRYFTYPIFRLDKFFSHRWSLIAQNMAVKKSAFVEIGGFKHVKIGEDADLSQRIAKLGKVVLDPTFIVLASGRRARHGTIQGVITYAPNAFSRTFLKTHKFDKLPTIREEKSALAKFSFIPLLISVVYLVILFTFMNTTFSDAKQELLSKTNASISKMKLRQIASELSPVTSWSNILHAGRNIRIFEEN